MSDEPLRQCPKCEGALKRVFYPVGIHFKGSGFYTTDYARKQAGATPKTGDSKQGERSDEKGADGRADTAKPGSEPSGAESSAESSSSKGESATGDTAKPARDSEPVKNPRVP